MESGVSESLRSQMRVSCAFSRGFRGAGCAVSMTDVLSVLLFNTVLRI